MTRPKTGVRVGWGLLDGDWNEARGSQQRSSLYKDGFGLAAQHAKVIYAKPLGIRCDSLTPAEDHTFLYVGIYVGK
jgi:hypothetical protein